MADGKIGCPSVDYASLRNKAGRKGERYLAPIFHPASDEINFFILLSLLGEPIRRGCRPGFRAKTFLVERQRRVCRGQ